MKTAISFFICLTTCLTTITTSALAGTPEQDGKAVFATKGKELFTANCMSCHGDKGDGNGPAGQLLNPKPRNFNKDKFKKGDAPKQIFGTISNGLPGTAMVSFSYIPETDRWSLAYYVSTFRPKKDATKAKPKK